MRVLQHACRVCRTGGVLLHLTTVPPAASIEVGGAVLASLDQERFLGDAAITESFVDAAVRAGALVEESRVAIDVLAHFDSGADAIADIDARPRTMLPAAVREALRDTTQPVVERSWSLLRRLRVE